MPEGRACQILCEIKYITQTGRGFSFFQDESNKEINDPNEFTIFTNHCDDFIKIEGLNESIDVEYTITNLNGEVILRGKINPTASIINLSQFIPNIYIIQIGEHVLKVLKQK